MNLEEECGYEHSDNLNLTGYVVAPKNVKVKWEDLLPNDMGSISEISGNGDNIVRRVNVVSYWERGPLFDRPWKFGDGWDEDRKLPETGLCIDESTGEEKELKVVWVLPEKLATDNDPSDSHDDDPNYRNTATRMNWHI